MKDRAEALLKEAVKKIGEANEELCRPEEDVVSVMVCKKAQRATENFLRGFLLKNNVEPGIEKTLDELLEKCLTINPNFSKVDLSHFDCRSAKLSSRQCNEVSKVSSCFVSASNLETFLRDEKVI
jgi:HEPN domain-containing protein